MIRKVNSRAISVGLVILALAILPRSGFATDPDCSCGGAGCQLGTIVTCGWVPHVTITFFAVACGGGCLGNIETVTMQWECITSARDCFVGGNGTGECCKNPGSYTTVYYDCSANNCGGAKTVHSSSSGGQSCCFNANTDKLCCAARA